jgi:uncharacterized membrane protein YphA (DoxX/SURF4 family)
MRWVRLVLRLALAGVFLYAAYAKLSQPWLLFAMSIDSYGMLPQWAVFAVARTLPWLELLLGLLLASGLALPWVALTTSVQLAIFLAVMLRAWMKGLGIDCGCFGTGEALGWKTLVRDGSLALGSVVLTISAFKARKL